jgi:hypothetical protein
MFQALAVAASLIVAQDPGGEATDPGPPPDPPPIVMTGEVRSSEVQPIPVADVVVTVTSPSLQGEQLVVTDERGRFRLPGLPRGTYTVRLEKEGYRPYWRAGIELQPYGPGDIGVFVLLPEPMGDVVFFCPCGPPLVDIGRAQGDWGVALSSVSLVPLSAPFESGGVSRSFDTQVRLFEGLSAGPDGTRYGTDPTRELAFRLDGVSVRDPVIGLLAVPLAGVLVDESTAITAAQEATHGGSTSGWVEGSTFSGGNEIHGRIVATVTPEALDTSS